MSEDQVHDELLAQAAAATVRVVFAAHAWDEALRRLGEHTRAQREAGG